MTGVTAAVTAGLTATAEVFKWLNTKDALKYAEEALEVEERLRVELAKPFDEQNDSVVEIARARESELKDLALTQMAAYAKGK